VSIPRLAAFGGESHDIRSLDHRKCRENDRSRSQDAEGKRCRHPQGASWRCAILGLRRECCGDCCKRDNGGADNTGTATVIHCTNFSGVTERIRFVLRNFNSTLVGNVTNDVGHLSTLTKATHGTVNTEDLPHTAPGVGINQGTLAIAATSRNIVCTALVTDATTATPHGVALRGIRFNPATDSQE
jgi:hypothetical protein